MILANIHLRNDFSAMVTHLSTSLQLQGSLSDNPTRNISGLQSGHGNNARGRGRGLGNNRGGAGHGHGRGCNIYLGSYSPEQWATLSNEDKQRVRDGRANSNTQQQQQGRGNGQQANAKHSIAGITTEAGQQDDLVSAITMGTMTAGISNGGANNNDSRQIPTDTSNAGQNMSRRQRISALRTSERARNRDSFRIVSQLNMRPAIQQFYTGNCELDSHADTSVAGPNFVVLEYTDMSCNVSPFCKTYESKENVPIVKAATAYDDEDTGLTYILVLGQALYFGEEVETSLLCPALTG
jgi:hypothetical protein